MCKHNIDGLCGFLKNGDVLSEESLLKLLPVFIQLIFGFIHKSMKTMLHFLTYPD